MKKIVFLLAATLLLTGCGEEEKVKNAVRENLKDPESARFTNFVLSKDGSHACIEWNAKNGFGGYGQGDAAVVFERDGIWEVDSMQTFDRRCSVESIEKEAKIDNAFVSGKQEAIDFIEKNKGKPLSDLSKECQSMVTSYQLLKKFLARSEIYELEGMIQGDQNRIEEWKHEVVKANCGPT